MQLLRIVVVSILILIASCGKTDEYGDATQLDKNYYCPEVPANVGCPTTDNTTVDNNTVDNSTNYTGEVVTEYWDRPYQQGSNRFTMGPTDNASFNGRYYPSDDYWYVEVWGNWRQGCIPNPLTVSGLGLIKVHDNGSLGDKMGYWADYAGLTTDIAEFAPFRDLVPNFSQCYRMWSTGNHTMAMGFGCKTINDIIYCSTSPVWMEGDFRDNVSIAGTKAGCISDTGRNGVNGPYPECGGVDWNYIMDNATGKVVDNGTHFLMPNEVPLDLISAGGTHVCLRDNGSSCSYEE